MDSLVCVGVGDGGWWRAEVSLFSALLCLALVLAPYVRWRSSTEMSCVPFGLIISVMWFIPKLHRSLTLFVTWRRGYFSNVVDFRSDGCVIQGSEGIVYVWFPSLFIVIPDCCARRACWILNAYVGNQSLW